MVRLYRYICLAIFSAIILCVPLCACGAVSNNATVTSKNYILILNTHLESIEWNNNYEDAIITSLTNSNQAGYYTEHIKMLDIHSKADIDSVQNALFKKYVNRPRLVVFIGPAPAILFLDALNNHWKDIPVLDCYHRNSIISIENYLEGSPSTTEVSDKEWKSKYNITGISSNTLMKETLGLLLEVLPMVNNIVFISDERIGATVSRNTFKKALEKYYPTISYEFITPKDYTTQQLMKKVASYDTHTGIIFHNWALRGNSIEDYYEWNHIYKLLGNASRVPIFSAQDMNVEEGLIAGGYFTSNKDLSIHAISMMNEILNGKSPRDIPFVTPKKAKAYLNYTTIEKYDIPKMQFPPDAYYYNKPVDFWERYKYEAIFIGIVIFGIMIFFVQRLYFMARHQKEQKQQLIKEKGLRNDIQLRNVKLALALQVSTISPWIWDVTKKTFTFDSASNLIDSDADDGTYAPLLVSFDAFIDSIVLEDRNRMESLFLGLRNGKANYLKEECRMVDDENKNGESNWYMLQAVVYEKDLYGRPIVIVGTRTKITETKELEIELREAQRKAEDSSRLKSAFLANISHEIRTPLNAIVGFSGVLATTEDEDQKKELAGIVKHNNDLLLHLINDIIDISKLESDTMEFKYSTEDVNKVIDRIANSYADKAPQKVKIVTVKPLGQSSMYMEAKRVSQILENFMSNAVKYTKEGSIEIGYCTPEKDKIRFFVKDTGCGIPQDKLGTIFGRFVKLNTFEQGTGLGLSVCELLAEKLGGEVGVYSEYRIGSEFWLDIPFVENNNDATETETDKVVSDKKITILIADDMQSNYMVLHAMLDKSFNLVHAWNGKDAVEMFKKYHPRLILMDVKMPVMDGYTATAKIKELDPSVPIIALSAYAFDDVNDKMMSNGFTGYEPKPVNKHSLMQKIAASIGGNK